MVRRLTFNKIRLLIFIQSYPFFRISQEIKKKYKFDKNLKPQALKKQYFNKKVIPEISKLSKVLNLSYKNLWKAIVMDKTFSLSNRLAERQKIKVYLSIESELIQLTVAKQDRTDHTNPDYDDFQFLSLAIERAVGNRLINTKSDAIFEQQSEILQKSYLNWYYQVGWKYKLPTMRIVPFVLRLIS